MSDVISLVEYIYPYTPAEMWKREYPESEVEICYDEKEIVVLETTSNVVVYTNKKPGQQVTLNTPVGQVNGTVQSPVQSSHNQPSSTGRRQMNVQTDVPVPVPNGKWTKR